MKFVDQLHTQGLKPALLKQGEALIESTYKALIRNSHIKNYLEDLEKDAPEKLNQLFLSTIFSSAISANIEWVSEHSFKFIIQGSLLHDIGMSSLPIKTRLRTYEDLDPLEKSIYIKHPETGYKMLTDLGLPEQVKQIVYQHHEWVNGEGFPNRLSGVRIFPLAKIISFASDFSFFLINNSLSPIQGLNELVPNRDLVTRYDAACVKGFFKSFKTKTGVQN